MTSATVKLKESYLLTILTWNIILKFLINNSTKILSLSTTTIFLGSWSMSIVILAHPLIRWSQNMKKQVMKLI